MTGPIASSRLPLLQPGCRAGMQLSTARVVIDEQRPASFAALQSRLDGESRAEVVLYAFDVLFLDDRDLRPLSLNECRAALEKLIGKPTSGAILLSKDSIPTQRPSSKSPRARP